MSKEINYKNNPLHGLSLKNLLIEIVDHYGFDVLFAYLNINCFKTNPSIESSVKFLKKTDWAREKVEVLYLYQFKNLPRVSSEQFSLPPRDRIIYEGQMPGEPVELNLEDAERLREKRANKSAAWDQEKDDRSGKNIDAKRGAYPKKRDNSVWGTASKSSNSPSKSTEGKVDPWANAKNRSKH